MAIAMGALGILTFVWGCLLAVKNEWGSRFSARISFSQDAPSPTYVRVMGVVLAVAGIAFVDFAASGAVK